MAEVTDVRKVIAEEISRIVLVLVVIMFFVVIQGPI